MLEEKVAKKVSEASFVKKVVIFKIAHKGTKYFRYLCEHKHQELTKAAQIWSHCLVRSSPSRCSSTGNFKICKMG